MEKKITSVSNPKLSLNVLTQEEVLQIHRSTLEVIDEVGVRFPSEKALDVLEAHGAQVDRAKMIARIPGQVLEKYLAMAPPVYTLAARDPELDLPLDGNHSYLGTDGCGVEIIDAFSGERRRTTKADLEDVTRVADYLEAIAFHWVSISAQDKPPQSRGLHELQAVWRKSNKHVQTESIVDPHEMQAAVEMAAALAGGHEALRRRPLLSIMQCTLSPLGHDGGSLEAGNPGHGWSCGVSHDASRLDRTPHQAVSLRRLSRSILRLPVFSSPSFHSSESEMMRVALAPSTIL